MHVVKVLKKEFTPAHRDATGKAVPAESKIVEDKEAKPRLIQVGDVSFMLTPGEPCELPEPVLEYLKTHRYYQITDAEGKRQGRGKAAEG